jgi:murein L,D-transpeptidase YcbB/YkuD
VVLTASKDGSFKTLADKTEPTLVFYRYMSEAFAQYSAAEQVRKEVKFTRAGLSKEHPTEQVAQLRKFLTALGDIEASKTGDDAASSAYDEQLVEGIKHFQKRHGLATKGSINKETLNALNAPLAAKVEQMKLSLERLRWIPRFEEDRMVLVNIPSFQLWAFDSLKDEDAEPLTMRVVVGKAAGKQTPSFSSKMLYVEFRPTWSVPQSIIKHEFGNLLRNPGALAKRNMKVSYHNGVVSVRQGSGDHNALGLVKFLFPNNHSVYFHDTPSKHFFKQSRRDFSHGCVRLANPDLFAEFALNKQTDEWTMDKIKRAMHKGGQKRITLDAPVPVVIFYGTALAVDHSGVHFYKDVYGHDARLKAALEQSKKTASKKEKPKQADV